MQRSNLICIIFLLLFTVICQADEVGNYPVQWTAAINLKSLADIPQLLAKEDMDPVNYENRSNEHAVAKSCNDYFRLTKAGFYPANNMEIAGESFFKEKCEPLAYLLQAQSAKYSYIRNFNLAKDYGLLPAAIIFPNIWEGGNKNPSGDIKTNYPDTHIVTMKNSNETTIELISKKADMKTIISILAWGDFNHDGYDDMLVFIANYVLDGTYRYYSTRLLTRKNQQAPLIAIN